MGFILTKKIHVAVPNNLTILQNSSFRLNLLFNINIVLLCYHIGSSKLHSENPFGWFVFFLQNSYPSNVFTGTIFFAEAQRINSIPGFLAGLAFR